MNSKEWLKNGKEMLQFIANYLDTVKQRPVFPEVEPGYLRVLLPDTAPENGEPWEKIMADFSECILPGMTHWMHPRFHAFYPNGNSYPTIMADMISDAFGCIGFTWAACPASAELETIMMDWVGKMLGLPKEFLFSGGKGRGGGCIQGSASECILASLLAARNAGLKALRIKYPHEDDAVLMSKLVGYCSSESHSCVEKAANIALVKFRILECNEKCQMPPDILRQQIRDDKMDGLVPFFVSTTIGTTSTCAFDCLEAIGPICKEEKVWLHVDAAYAGSCLVCPEFRYLIKGLEYAQCFNFNPTKWLLATFDCSLMWVKDNLQLQEAFALDVGYLRFQKSDKVIDFRHWGIPLSRRFRSLKLWFLMRSYGVEGLQKYIREHCRLAKILESLIKQDNKFEMFNQVVLGLVCFRIKGSNELNRRLLNSINKSRELHLTGAKSLGKYFIRICISSPYATEADIRFAYKVISEFADFMLELVNKDDELRLQEEQFMKDDMESSQGSHTSQTSQTSVKVKVLNREISPVKEEKESLLIEAFADPYLYDPRGKKRGNRTGLTHFTKPSRVTDSS